MRESEPNLSKSSISTGSYLASSSSISTTLSALSTDLQNCLTNENLAVSVGCYEDAMPHLYPQAKGIILALKDREIDMAIASRSPTPEIAKRFLDKLGIRSIFVAEEVYSSWTHQDGAFDKIHWTTGVPYSRMLFFDDENRNIEAVSKMGVTSIYVNNGVNLRALREGLLSFSHKCGSSGAV